MGVELKPFGRQALCRLGSRRARRRDDSFDHAVFESGVNPANAIEPVRRDPSRRNTKGRLDRFLALVEAARVMFFAGHDPHVNDDARKIVNG